MKWVTNIWGHLRELWQYQHEPERLRRLADLYWHALLLLAAIVITGSILYGGIKLFAALESEEESSPLSSEGGGILLNPAHLEETLNGFAKRKADYELFKKSPPAIADPSR